MIVNSHIGGTKSNNNYLTIDISGNNPAGNGNLSAVPSSAGAATISITQGGPGAQTNREAMLANRVPR